MQRTTFNKLLSFLLYILCLSKFVSLVVAVDYVGRRLGLLIHLVTNINNSIYTARARWPSLHGTNVNKDRQGQDNISALVGMWMTLEFKARTKDHNFVLKDDRQRFLQKVSKKQFRIVYYNAIACG